MEFGISRRDLVQLVKIGMQSREMGRCIKNVVCFFLCPDADCLRNNLSFRIVDVCGVTYVHILCMIFYY